MASPEGEPGGRARQDSWTDAELVAGLAQAPTSEPLWHVFHGRCVGRMITALHGLVLQDRLGEVADRLGRPIRLSAAERDLLRTDEHLRGSLVDDSVLASLELFERLLREDRGWHPDGGAGLLTYLINGSVRALVDRLRVWRRTRDRDGSCSPVDPARLAAALSELAADDHPLYVGDADDAMAFLRTKDLLVVDAIEQRAATDEHWSVIAGRLGITPKALERRLSRARAYLRRHGGRRDGHD